MQPGFWKKAAAVYILLCIGSKILFHFIKMWSSGYDRAHVFRFAQIIDINLLMLLGTVFVWARLNALFSLTDVKKFNNDDFKRQKYKSAIFNVTYLIFALFVHWAHFTFYFFRSPNPTFLPYFCLFAFGVWTHLVFFFFGFSLLNFFIRLVQACNTGREILKPCIKYTYVKSILTDARSQTWTALMLTAVFSCLQSYGANQLYVKRVDIVLPGLSENFHGFKIVLLSDLHAGPTIGQSAFWRVVNVTNELEADIVVIAGDLVDGSHEYIKGNVLPLKYLTPKRGVYFATGNHEYYYGRVDDWLTFFESKLNIRVLHNSNTKLYDKSASYICLAGVDDIFSSYLKLDEHGLYFAKALNSCETQSTKILIAHNPKAAKLAGDSDRTIDLILSGHVHAGQMYIVAPVTYLTMPYFYGLYTHSNGHTLVYVTSGTYFWGAPLKMIGFAQITQITLNPERAIVD